MDKLFELVVVVGAICLVGSILERVIPAWVIRRFFMPVLSVGIFYFLSGFSLLSVLAGLASSFFAVVLLHLLDDSNVKVVRRR